MVQDGVAGLADMEAAFGHLQAQRIAVEDFLQRAANGDGDPDDVKPFGSQDESSNKNNILLPSMNRVWPQLVPCLRHTQPSVNYWALPCYMTFFSFPNCLRCTTIHSYHLICLL